MAKEAQVFVADVFTDTVGQGNRTGVVFDGRDFSSEEMMGMAFALRHPIVYMLPPEGEGTVRLRFVAPGAEPELSGHSAIGAVWMMAAGAQGGPSEGVVMVPVETQRGTLRMLVHLAGGQPEQVTLELPVEIGAQQEPEPASRALGLHHLSVRVTGLPVTVVHAGQPKLLVPVVNVHALNNLEPSPEAVADLCAQLGVTGIYAFSTDALEPGLHARARHFSPGFPAEDSVTAEGAGALAAFLYAHKAVSDGPVQIGQTTGKVAVDLAYEGERPTQVAVRGRCAIAGRVDLTLGDKEAEPQG